MQQLSMSDLCREINKHRFMKSIPLIFQSHVLEYFVDSFKFEDFQFDQYLVLTVKFLFGEHSRSSGTECRAECQSFKL